MELEKRKAVIDVTKNLTIENTTINAYQNAIKLDMNLV